MGCRGVLFAIDADTAEGLIGAESDDELMELVEELEEAWVEEHLAETDKSWDAMHRALTDGTLGTRGGALLGRAILGGQHLHEGDGYIVSLVPADEVPEVAQALAGVDEAAFRERYFRLVPRDYAPEYGEEDAGYTWGYLKDVAALYARAAANGRSVVFTVDQ
jgi:hypothetical protein